MGILDQTERIATELYGADGILIEPAAKRQLDRFVKWGYGTLPVCMAKTQYSFSHDPSLLGAPTGFTVPVREFRLSTGAGFIVAILGNMMMPGLPAYGQQLRRWTSTSMGTSSGCSVDAHERFLPELLNQPHMQILSKEPERWRLRVTSEDDLWALAQLIRPRMQFGMVGERRDQTTASGEGERARELTERKTMWILLGEIHGAPQLQCSTSSPWYDHRGGHRQGSPPHPHRRPRQGDRELNPRWIPPLDEHLLTHAVEAGTSARFAVLVAEHDQAQLFLVTARGVRETASFEGGGIGKRVSGKEADAVQRSFFRRVAEKRSIRSVTYPSSSLAQGPHGTASERPSSIGRAQLLHRSVRAWPVELVLMRSWEAPNCRN